MYDPTVRCIYLYGGSKNKKWFNDVHMLDVDEWKWQVVQVGKGENLELGEKKLIICFSGTARVTFNPPHQKIFIAFSV